MDTKQKAKRDGVYAMFDKHFGNGLGDTLALTDVAVVDFDGDGFLDIITSDPLRNITYKRAPQPMLF